MKSHEDITLELQGGKHWCCNNIPDPYDWGFCNGVIQALEWVLELRQEIGGVTK